VRVENGSYRAWCSAWPGGASVDSVRDDAMDSVVGWLQAMSKAHAHAHFTPTHRARPHHRPRDHSQPLAPLLRPPTACAHIHADGHCHCHGHCVGSQKYHTPTNHAVGQLHAHGDATTGQALRQRPTSRSRPRRQRAAVLQQGYLGYTRPSAYVDSCRQIRTWRADSCRSGYDESPLA
jgi:hypothetical protein